MLQIGPERLVVIGVRNQHVRAGAVIDVPQEGYEGLALIGFAVAPADQCRGKQKAHCTADGAIES